MSCWITTALTEPNPLLPPTPSFIAAKFGILGTSVDGLAPPPVLTLGAEPPPPPVVGVDNIFLTLAKPKTAADAALINRIVWVGETSVVCANADCIPL